MRAGKIILAILGVLIALAGVGLLAGGGGLLWAYGTQRSGDGFFTSSSIGLDTDTYALESTELDLGSRPGDWFPSGRLATVKFAVEPAGTAAVFVGIGPASDVDDYLSGVGSATVTDIRRRGDRVDYDTTQGGAPATPPSDQGFWAASAEGPGAQNLTWDLEQGEWTVVIMNADASAGVDVDVRAGAKTDLLVPLAIALLVGGIVFAGVAALLLVLAFRRAGPAPVVGGIAEPGAGVYPVVLEGRLDPNLTRWQWLVKWLLAIPHYIILGFLWAAFVVLTVIAFFAILFTGRYPRAIFDFNVGVMRWSWRVGYYSYSALGTDQYPPFSLGPADYPASFDVAYPERLSRGLVLVKWWLLAIPHYLIVGLLTSGLVWWTTDLTGSEDRILEIGGGLIGILVLVAAIALLFTGKYPQGLFDLIVGLNRWVFRVGAYATLMTDEYPPFRLDTGPTEPGTTAATPAAEPEGGTSS